METAICSSCKKLYIFCICKLISLHCVFCKKKLLYCMCDKDYQNTLPILPPPF